MSRDPSIGIRPRVWLGSLAILGLCFLAISLTRWTPSHPADPRLENVALSPALNAPHLRASRRGSARRSESASRLTSEEARTVACQTANKLAKELYGCQPFAEGTLPTPDGNGWFWRERQGHRSGDFEATIHLGPDGSPDQVNVLLLHTGDYL